MNPDLTSYWSLKPEELMKRLGTTPTGLSSEDAVRRLREDGPNTIRELRTLSRRRVLWSQLRSRPGTILLVSTMIFIPVAFAIPHLPAAHILGFVPMTGALAFTLAAITILYVVSTEFMKKSFYRRSTA